MVLTSLTGQLDSELSVTLPEVAGSISLILLMTGKVVTAMDAGIWGTGPWNARTVDKSPVISQS